jgi:predicted cupin superfamily sugar epimerase
MDPALAALIARLDLRPHPEGGWYRETFRDPRTVRAEGFDGPRSASTAIYFVLAAGHFSAFHRIRSDEVWHHYAGDDVEVSAIARDGALRTHSVGHRAPGASPQAVVPAGEWFASRVVEGGRWALVGCTVAPGFDFADFELADRAALTAQHPAHAALIASLTR